MFDEAKKQHRNVLHFIPPKPIKHFTYLCDKVFHIEMIEELYEQHPDYGIIHIDGCQFSFYILNGIDLYDITKTTRKKLPRTHKRGGQSQNRIARLRDEAIHNYLVKINEKSLELFIDDLTTLPNINGLVIIGGGNKKTKLVDLLDSRLKNILLGTLTMEYLDSTKIIKLVNKSIKDKETQLINYILDISNEHKLEYGQKEIITNLQNGMMEMIVITKEIEKKIKKTCDIKKLAYDLSCRLHITEYHNVDLDNMGGIIGLKWY